MIKEKVKLSHTVLYAKGWYKKTDDIFEDLKRILQYDNYEPFTKSDVISILVRNYEDSFNFKLLNFLSDIHFENCWKFSYWVKNSYQSNLILKETDLPEYDYYTAIVYKILSAFRDLSSEEWIIKTPKYSKTEKRPDNISLQTVIERFNYKSKSKK